METSSLSGAGAGAWAPEGGGIELSPPDSMGSFQTGDDNTTVSPDPIIPSDEQCNYYIKNNTVHYFDFQNQYGGIPQNLVINVITWFGLMLLFAFLRKVAGNYGRLALVRKDDDESKWTQLFFAPDETNIITDGGQEEGVMETETTDSLTSVDYSEVDNRAFSWIWAIFTLSDDKYFRKCGADAVQYLKFQRHLILFVLIITVVCIGIILPINFQGKSQGSELDFGHTTISNLEGKDARLWVHVVLTILFLPLGIFIMRRFSINLQIGQDEDCISSRTLMIVGIPRTYCTKDLIIRHFHEAYQDFEIDDVQIAFDVSKLCDLDYKRERSRRARIYCENHNSKHGCHLNMKPWACGILCNSCTCCCTGNQVDSLTFYKKEEQMLMQEVEKEKAKIQSKNIGIAFVTFSSLSDARKVQSDHQNHCQCLSSAPTTSLSKVIGSQKWQMKFAPPPEDIYWENLNSSHRFFFFKALFINIVAFVFLFFFTSPTYIISQMELVLDFRNASSTLHLPEKVNDFIPTLILWTLSALIPIIIGYSDWWMGHWRRSVENLWIMRKVFFYLLFMVLILPSVGMTTLKGLFEFFIRSKEEDYRIRWQCIFLPDNGAFFVNYVITSSFVGIALEFMRFSELFMYAMRMMVARSIAETPSIRKANVYEFPFGFNYSWMLLIFAITCSYCVVCPLITPFGLFYLVMKHGVDRYNLYFAYKRSKINKNIHSTAVNCVIISLLIQQLILLFFNIVRGQTSNNVLSPRAIFSITMFTIFSLLFAIQIFFHVFKGFSPIQYTSTPLRGAGYESENQSGDHSRDPQNEEESQNKISTVPAANANSGPSDEYMNGAAAWELNMPNRIQKNRRHKQFVPEVLRRDVFVHAAAPLVPYHNNTSENVTIQREMDNESDPDTIQEERNLQPSPPTVYGSFDQAKNHPSEDA